MNPITFYAQTGQVLKADNGCVIGYMSRFYTPEAASVAAQSFSQSDRYAVSLDGVVLTLMFR